MKNYKYLISGICVVCALAACTPKVDDYFEQTASARLKSNIDRTYQILRSAEYGWEFEYYPGEDLDYGGIIYTVKFDSLTAAVSCSLVPDSVETTLYRMTNDNGPVLTFDSYNSLLHYYSTPSSGEYQAKGGEFEFVVDSIADDFVSLYGKKTRNAMCLRKLTSESKDYATKTVGVFDHFVDSIRGTIGGVEVSGKCNPTNRTISLTVPSVFSDNASGNDTVNVHFAFTDKGIRLYRPLTLGGQKVQNFAFDQETKQLTCIDAGAESVQLEGIPYANDFMSYSMYEGDYSLVYTNGPADVSLIPNRLEGTYLLHGLSPKYDLKLHYDSSTGNLTLGSQQLGERDGKSIYWVCFDYDQGFLSLIDEGQFTIQWNKNRFYPVFNFRPTAPNILNCTGGLLIYVYLGEDGNAKADIVDDASWLTNGNAQFAAIKSLSKKSRIE